MTPWHGCVAAAWLRLRAASRPPPAAQRSTVCPGSWCAERPGGGGELPAELYGVRRYAWRLEVGTFMEHCAEPGEQFVPRIPQSGNIAVRTRAVSTDARFWLGVPGLDPATRDSVVRSQLHGLRLVPSFPLILIFRYCILANRLWSLKPYRLESV